METSQIKVELQSVFGNDRDIASAAWTSSLDYQKKQSRTDQDVKRVINLLADSKHSTPFESIIFRWWIKMPIQTDRQFMTHRLQSANGMSGRYRTMPSEFLSIPQDIENVLYQMGADVAVRQMHNYSHYCEQTNSWYNKFLSECKQAKQDNQINNDQYKRLREFFRGVLPQNNMTERVSTMNLRSWCNFYRLRSAKDAQPEIQQVANLMIEEIKKNSTIPYALEALERNGWVI